MKIALYSCNFGNYRNEFKNYYNTIFNNDIDYFLFSDKELNNFEKKKLKKWIICKIDLKNINPEIMDSYRETSKYVKFVLDNKLKSYDIIIWIDSKKLKNTIDYLNIDKIKSIIDKYPNIDVFNLKHKIRTKVQEELLVTIDKKLENVEAGKIFLSQIKDYVSNFDLVDTCIIIRKNKPIVNEAFEYCFELLQKHKLKRDQNVYNIALDYYKITPMLLNYNNLNFLCKN
jgi:hypothetical protein